MTWESSIEGVEFDPFQAGWIFPVGSRRHRSLPLGGARSYCLSGCTEQEASEWMERIQAIGKRVVFWRFVMENLTACDQGKWMNMLSMTMPNDNRS